VIWTAVGYLISATQHTQDAFIAEWSRMQAFFCIAFGVWLLLIAKSGTLTRRARQITREGARPPQGVLDRRLRVLVITLVGFTGSASFIGMGFNAAGATLVFMWILCVFICFLAGAVTLHTADLLLVIQNLQTTPLKLHLYSPARTPELRAIVSYFTFFTLVLTIAYAFACVGTLKGNWTGDQMLVEAVKMFWPAVYVPVCSIALVYPHIVVHKLIQRVKDTALTSYQNEMDGLLGNYDRLNENEVQRVNTLAQVFDRLSATPDYVIDVGIATRTVLPHLINLAIFFAKPLLGTG
jgi:hypothetical protein